MDWIDRLWRQAVGKSTASKQHDFEEGLERDEQFLAQFDAWKINEEAKSITSQFFELPHNGAASSQANAIYSIDRESSASKLIQCDKGRKYEDYQFLLDYWMLKTKAQGYTKYSSHVKYKTVGNGTKITERHYLKPTYDRSGELPVSQQYGNVTLTFVRINDVPDHLQWHVSWYHDRNYKQPKDYEELWARIMG